MRTRTCKRPWPIGGVCLATLFGAWACVDDPPQGLEGAYGFDAVVFVQRPHALNAGSLVAPTAGRVGGRAMMLEPAAPSGKLTPLTDADDGDVLGLDVSADGKRVVVSHRTALSDRYHLVEVELAAIKAGQTCFADDGDLNQACTRLTFGPADDTQPVYLPDGRIGFTRSNPDGPMDFEGRGPARSFWVVDPDGSAAHRIEFGPGHALGVSLLGDGWLRAVRWTTRDGLAVFLPYRFDSTASRPAQPNGLAADNSGVPLHVTRDALSRTFAACVPPVGTWGAGTICQLAVSEGVFLGVVTGIPSGAGCSPEGRLRDPTPLSEGAFLASYAKVPDGCVSVSDGDLGLVPDFGIVVVDVRTGVRRPVFNDPDFDDLQVRPVRARALIDPGTSLPANPSAGCQTKVVRLEGFVGSEAQASGVVRLRFLQGNSGADVPWAVELGGRTPGALCQDPGGTVSVAQVFGDGSFSAELPSGVPLRLQALDRYGAAVLVDPVWRGGPACAQRSCTGCHANEGSVAGFGTSIAGGQAATDLTGPEAAQRDFDFERDIQPILTRTCATANCHDSLTSAGSYVDLNGSLRGLDLHAEAAGRTSVAYQNLLFVDSLRNSSNGQILEQVRPYVEPGRASLSRLTQKLGAPCRWQCQDAPAWASWGLGEASHHPEDQPAFSGSLPDQDRWDLIEWIDAGAPFHGRGANP